MVTELATTSGPARLPEAREPIHVRVATMDDLPFIDSLQKLHTKMVGWMPTQQLEQKILRGQALVAEELVVSCELSVVSKAEERLSGVPSSLTTNNSQLTTNSSPLGYCIGQDQYFKRDDLGIVYQMNVRPGKQRGLVGATLLAAMFERAAWGCKLFCCWCAQDIAANQFWEAMGFVPLAYRAGSREKGRVHIFWQRRIRRGDTSTPFWFPCQTNSGSIREDRLVLPIQPGMHWSEVRRVILPGEKSAELKVLSAEGKPKPRGAKTQHSAPSTQHSIAMGGLRFAVAKEVAPKPVVKKKPCPEGTRRGKLKNDPKLVAAARELRDRWLEVVNGEQFALPAGKYDVSRQIEGRRQSTPEVLPSLRAIAA